MHYGMATMTHRTTFALDDATVTRIRRLAAQWQVSQAEVIRRVVAQSDAALNPDPVAMLDALHRAGEGLTAADAASYLTAVREGRKSWSGA
jgi:putative heme degradation protein